jgi:hypothetical protein
MKIPPFYLCLNCQTICHFLSNTCQIDGSAEEKIRFERYSGNFGKFDVVTIHVSDYHLALIETSSRAV